LLFIIKNHLIILWEWRSVVVLTAWWVNRWIKWLSIKISSRMMKWLDSTSLLCYLSKLSCLLDGRILVSNLR
jgi:hypothetical protein